MSTTLVPVNTLQMYYRHTHESSKYSDPTSLGEPALSKGKSIVSSLVVFINEWEKLVDKMSK